METIYIADPIFPQPQKAEKDKEADKLETLATQASRILFTVKTVFPFDPFPKKIIVDENKIDIFYNTFFATTKLFPIMLSDILTVKVSTGIFFASMEFEIEDYETNPPPINYLPRTDAIKAERIITGLIAAKRAKVDLSKLRREEVLRNTEYIGYSNQDLAD